jgi:lysophospholipase L1-like esterase
MEVTLAWESEQKSRATISSPPSEGPSPPQGWMGHRLRHRATTPLTCANNLYAMELRAPVSVESAMKTSSTPFPKGRRRGMRWLTTTTLVALVVAGVQVGIINSGSASPLNSRANSIAVGVASPSTTSVPSAVTRSPRSETSKSKVPLDTPVADVAPFRLPSRGCGFTPLSALVSASTSTSTTTPQHAPFALGHCRLLEIGDSLGDDLEYGIRHELQSTPGLKLIQRNKVSTGLSASWFYNWPAHLKSDLHDYHPNLVVIMFGANDEQALRVDGASQPFGSPKWRSAYIARVRRIDRMVTKAGAYAFWVGLPIAAPTTYSQGLRALNAIYRQVATSTPGVTFQPMWHLLATKGGNYRGGAVVNKVPSALRMSDGIHFTSTGELVIGTFVSRQLATVYDVNLRPEEPAYIDR